MSLVTIWMASKPACKCGPGLNMDQAAGHWLSNDIYRIQRTSMGCHESRTFMGCHESSWFCIKASFNQHVTGPGLSIIKPSVTAANSSTSGAVSSPVWLQCRDLTSASDLDMLCLKLCPFAMQGHQPSSEQSARQSAQETVLQKT